MPNLSNFKATQTLSTQKYLCLCADDFGFSEAINTGILELVKNQRLQAVSCMTQSPLWQVSAANLLPFRSHIDIGLHINFTQDFGQNYHFALTKLMRKSWFNQLDKQQIIQSIEQQWQSFVDVTGFEPYFVDGHQHIHQFPVIREALITFLVDKNFKGWVRGLQGLTPSQPYLFKTALLNNLGAISLAKLCQASQIPQNQQFFGVYDFALAADYAKLMHTWLSKVQHQALLMCHPAKPPLNMTQQNTQIFAANDSILAARFREFNYLSSAEFLALLQAYDIKLSPLSKTLSIPDYHSNFAQEA